MSLTVVPAPAIPRDVVRSGWMETLLLQPYLQQVGNTYATVTAAVQQAENDLPAGSGGVLKFPPGTWTLDNVSLTKAGGLAGDSVRTVLQPGASGRIFTANGSGFQGIFSLDRLAIGELSGSSPDRAPGTPLMEFQQFSGYIDWSRIYARMTGTGLLAYFNSSGNLSVSRSLINTGSYAMPFEFDDTISPFQADTISFDKTITLGLYMAAFRPESGTFTFDWHQSKIVSPNTFTLLDHSLSANALAGAQTITLQTGQGASWANGDPVYIEGDFAVDAAQRSGQTVEVNRVTGVTGDVLTLAQPLRFNHGTNGNTFTVQVIRGGVGLSLSSNLSTGGGNLMHFENLAFGVMDAGTINADWQKVTYTANRFIRFSGNAQDVTFGTFRCSPRGGENHLYDIPAWSAAAGNLNRFKFEGPFFGSPTVLDNGTIRALTADPANPAFSVNKSYEQHDTLNGVHRTTQHTTGTSNRETAYRVGWGTTFPLSWLYDGTLLMQSGIVEGVTPVTAASYTVVTSDRNISCQGNIAQAINLPAVSAVGVGFMLTVKDQIGTAGTQNKTIARNGTDTIDGATSVVINTNFGVVRLLAIAAGSWAVI